MPFAPTLFRYRQSLLVEAGGALGLVTLTPGKGLSPAEFNKSCEWNDREDAAVRARGAVRCLRENAGSAYFSPSTIPVGGVPDELLAALDTQPKDQYLFSEEA